MRLLLPLLCGWLAAPAFSQPSRGIGLFGTVGVMRGAGDEGSEGSAPAYGGAVTIPFAARWAVDVQALTSQFGDRPDVRLRRVLLSPALQYRRGSDRALWFIAFGPGLQRDRARGTTDADSGLTLHWRTGAVFEPTPRLLVRGEFFWAQHFVLPSVGVAVSLGVRLGR
jgi:hypothetical protein